MKCLVVDDDILCRKEMTSLMQEVAHCEEAAEGRGALAKFTRALKGGDPYDLVILDVAMPGMSGNDTAKRIRETERELSDGKKVHIIVVSELYSVNDAMESFCKAQPAAFLLKPVSRTALLAAVAKLDLCGPAPQCRWHSPEFCEPAP